jgi:uncharacterized protein (DUF1499 family)
MSAKCREETYVPICLDGGDEVNVMLTIVVVVSVVAAIAVSGFFLVGPKRIWSLFGPPDLGPVAFETLVRRTTPNDALACPPNFCKATSDLVPPLFGVDLAALRLAVAKLIASEKRTVLTETDDTALTERYIQRSALMQFPDTIVVRYIGQPEGRSTLAIYSRSQLGESDLGVNLARLERWLGKLRQLLPVVQ